MFMIEKYFWVLDLPNIIPANKYDRMEAFYSAYKK